MNNSKKINVNYSSLVGLKAELLRKQTEVKDAKVKTEVISTPTKNKTKIKKPTLKIEKQLIDTDDIKAHQKSKLMLEAKARLYENLKKSRNNKHEHFLVDFQSKSDSEDEINFEDYQEVASDPEDDWVEYEDCFGRTRKCLRRDLSKMQEKDEFVRQEVSKKSLPNECPDNVAESEIFKIVPKEPEIEIMRKKWEEQTEKLADKTNIHYQDILFDEARTHGVGYYGFSQDEEERAKQQSNLNALRKETLAKQKEAHDVKELKSKLEENRLKAARIRQRIRAGLPPEPVEEEIEETKIAENTSQDEIAIESNPHSDENQIIARKEENPLIEIENKIKAFGELLGKRTQWHEMSQEEWVHKRRKDRLDEFGPRYDNFKRSGYLENEITDLPIVGSSNNKSPILNHEISSNAAQTSQNIDSSTQISDRQNEMTDDTDLGNENDVNCSSICATESHNEIDGDVKDNIEEESDSDDSSIIGPLPLSMEPTKSSQQISPPVLKTVEADLSNIDFSRPPPNMQLGTTSLLWPPHPSQDMPICASATPTYANADVNLHSSSKCESHQVISNPQDVLEPIKVTNEYSCLNQPEKKIRKCDLNEDTIAAGLKYLRANFELQKKVDKLK